MKRLFSAKTLVVASLALGAVGLASAAHARSDVVLSIGLNVPVAGYVHQAPAYVVPQPVYVQPRTAYVQPQTVYYGYDRRDRYDRDDRFDRDDRHDRRWERRAAWRDADRDGVPNIYDRDSRFYDARLAQRRGGWRDADHDGVANRYDNAPRNPYRY
jgi:hypothetical protein